MNTEETLPTELLGGPSRRMVLVAGAAGASTLVLAACSQAPAPGSKSPASGGSSSDGSASAGNATAGSSAAPNGSSPSAAGNAAVLAPLSSVGVGKAVAAKDASGGDIIISRTGDSTVEAFSAICPHQGCTVGADFVCPCHGSTFDPKTGARLSGPAQTGLATVAVSISGGNVVAG